MRTLTLDIEDAYYKKVVDFLELLPKKAVKNRCQVLGISKFSLYKPWLMNLTAGEQLLSSEYIF